jgi:hypothetical protein
VKPAEIIPMSREQLGDLARKMPPGVELTVWLMRGCGLRISEAMAVKFSGFRMGGKILRITEQAAPDGYAPPDHETKGGRSLRTAAPAACPPGIAWRRRLPSLGDAS